MKRFLDAVPQGLQQSLVMIVGNGLAYFFSALSVLLITRILGPTQFGYFSVGFALLLMLVKVNDLGSTFVLQRYAAQAQDKAEANKIFSYTLKLKLILSLVIFGLGIFLAEPLSSLLNFRYPVLIFLAFALSAVTMLYEHLQAMLQSLHCFYQSVLANMLQASSKLLGAILLFVGLYFSFSPDYFEDGSVVLTAAVFCFYMASPLIPVILKNRLLPRWVSFSFSQNFTKQRKLITSLAVHSAVGVISLGLIENIDILFVQGYLNTYEAGLLGGVSRVALIFNLIAVSLATVLNPRVAKYRSYQSLYAFISKSWLVVGASMAALVILLPFSDLLIQYTIGPEYLVASFTLKVLLVAAFVTIALVPFTTLFFSFDAPWYFSVSGLLQLAIILLGNWMFVPTFGIEATAWVRLIAKIAVFIFTVCTAIWYYRTIKRR